MYCSKCGKPVDDDDRFCWNCGREVKKVTEKTAREEESAPLFFSPSAEEEAAAPAATAGTTDGAVTEDVATPAPSDTVAQDSAPHRISTDEFVWNIHEFHRPTQKPEKIYVDWTSGKVIEVDAFGNRLDAAGAQAEVSETQPTGHNEERQHTPQVEHFTPKAENHSEQVPETRTEAPPFGAAGREEHADDVPVTIEDITKDIEESNADLKRATARIDKFYTFNQKNEEFQKLLDKEYERVHGTVPPDTAQIFLEFERLTNPDFQEPETTAEERDDHDFVSLDMQAGTAPAVPAAAAGIHTLQKTDPAATQAETAKDFDPVEHLKGAAAARQAELARSGIFDNDTLIQRFDTMQLEKDLLDETIVAAADDVAAPKKKGFRTAMLDELFGEIEPEQDALAVPQTVAVEGADTSAVDADDTAADTYKADLDTLKSPADQQGNLDAQLGFVAGAPAREEVAELKPQEPAEADIQTNLDAQLGLVTDASAEGEESDTQNIDEVQNGDHTDIDSMQAKVETATDTATEDTQEKVDTFLASMPPEGQKSGAGRSIGRTLLVIVVILLLACLTAIGIRQFAPESDASRFIDKTFSAVSETFAGLTAKMGLGDDEPQMREPEGTDNDLPAMMTMQEIIASQIGNNTNIESISYDLNIGYDKSIDYGNTDLNTSVSLAQKYPQIEDYNKNASDIVGTLISFDSLWIDYVNTRDRAVFDLLKANSNAYRNCNAYKKAGLVKKYFKELKLGDIRAGAKGYYVWANEKIVTVENGKSTEENFSWIYYFESDGTNLRLVDYMRDKG